MATPADFEQRIAAMPPAQMADVLLAVAAAWRENDYLTVGVVLEDNGLTDTDDEEDDDDGDRLGP